MRILAFLGVGSVLAVVLAVVFSIVGSFLWSTLVVWPFASRYPNMPKGQKRPVPAWVESGQKPFGCIMALAGIGTAFWLAWRWGFEGAP